MNELRFAVVERDGFGHSRSNQTQVVAAYATLAQAKARIRGRRRLMVIESPGKFGPFELGEMIWRDTIRQMYPVVAY